MDELGSLALLGTAVAWIVFVAGWVAGLPSVNGGELVAFWLVLVVALVISRSAGRAFVRRRAALLQNTIIIGTGSSARRMARLVLRHSDYRLNLLGFVPAAVGEAPSGLAAAVVCSSPDDLLLRVREMGVERAIGRRSGRSAAPREDPGKRSEQGGIDC